MYQFVVSPCASPPDEPFPFWKQLPRAPVLRFGKYCGYVWKSLEFPFRTIVQSAPASATRCRSPCEHPSGSRRRPSVYDNFPSVHTNKYRKSARISKNLRIWFFRRKSLYLYCHARRYGDGAGETGRQAQDRAK